MIDLIRKRCVAIDSVIKDLNMEYHAIKSKVFVTLEINESETTNKECKAKITITNEKGLQLVYKGIISYYVNPLLFYYSLEKIK